MAQTSRKASVQSGGRVRSGSGAQSILVSGGSVLGPGPAAAAATTGAVAGPAANLKIFEEYVDVADALDKEVCDVEHHFAVLELGGWVGGFGGVPA